MSAVLLAQPACLLTWTTPDTPQAKLDELTEIADTLSDRMRVVAEATEPLREEHRVLREELFHIRHTTDKYTDSDKASS